MPTTDARVDAYIEKAPEFAKPLLRDWRAQVHKTCPEVVEAIKWSMPFFTYKNKMLCHMAAFKAHFAVGFWHGDDVVQKGAEDEAMGQLGRITSAADMPPRKEQAAMLKRAMALIDEGAKPGWAQRRALASKQRPPPEMPQDLAAAFAQNAVAAAHFKSFPPSAQREYTDWLLEAKRPETRARRLEQAMQLLTDGKRRYWKYENC